MRFVPKTKKNQADEIVHYFYQEKWDLEDRLEALGIQWRASTFEDELVGLQQRIKTYGPMAGISLSEDEERELTFWIEQRIHDEVWRVVEACLRRLHC
jgi:hypothetical protein